MFGKYTLGSKDDSVRSTRANEYVNGLLTTGSSKSLMLPFGDLKREVNDKNTFKVCEVK